MGRPALLDGQLVLDFASLAPAPPPDPHRRGWVTLPYDTAALGKTGDVVPAWVCCRCGGAEISEFTLDINHGCCRCYVPACEGRRRPGSFDAHWTADRPDRTDGAGDG